MKLILFAAGVAMMMSGGTGPVSAGGSDGDGHTTIVQDANGQTVITQSGDPARAEVRIVKEPGRTTVYRKSGGNTAVVTQSTDPADLPPNLGEWLQGLSGR
ncbi:hypothetical protein QA640_16610 [Bradyrhizobium sp. CB82]|uniref:hypothetical protein n=1 Tax=Bradyrhizobium sp. CB82 TaxID=3039159 RepID=UPI0024B0E4A4|nr:hypothetical protein [Bradyrhizobium sp. CB82]WFU43923.1 hypothetical protein QA640_16610 [Bradyrhizobium sp. CB82]